MPCDYRSRIRYNRRVFEGGEMEMDGASYIPTAIRTCSTPTATTMAGGSTRTSITPTTIGTTTARLLSSSPQLSSFPGTFSNLRMCLVLLFQLPTPATEHLADLVHLFRQHDVFIRIERICFPEDHQEQLQHICFSDREPHIRQFLIAREKCGC